MTHEKGRLPWFPCEPTPLLGALAALKPDQQVVYVVVLLRIYEVGGPCPDTLDALSRRTGLNKRRVSDALDHLFRTEKLVRDGAGIMNPKARGVLARIKGKREKASHAGQEGAASRWGKDKQDQSAAEASAIATPMAKNAELELDLEEKVSKTPPNGGARARRPRAQRVRMPDSWTPDEAGIAYAAEFGFANRAAVDCMIRACRNYHQKHGTLIASFPATWRSWVDNEVKFSSRTNGRYGSAPRPTFADIARGGH